MTDSVDGSDDPTVFATLPDADIYLVGYGHRTPGDLTLAGSAALRRCRRVLGFPPSPVDLPGPSPEDLRVLYRPNWPRSTTYRLIVDRVIEAARSSPPVALTTFGSPVVGVSPSHQLIKKCATLALKLEIVPAPSFLDWLWIELVSDPFDGVAVWDATRFLALEVPPQTAGTLVLTQVGMLNLVTGPYPGGKWPEADLKPLRDYLLRWYPADHSTTLMVVASSDQKTQQIRQSLAGLERCPNVLCTLVVGPTPKSQDRLIGLEEKLVLQNRAESAPSPTITRIVFPWEPKAETT